MDGGRVAARGLLYQYQRTLEVVLECLEEGGVAGCRVEGDSAEESSAVNAVDFDILGDDGRVRLAVQVKSTATHAALGPADVVRILDRLTARDDADIYQILTNAPFGRAVSDIFVLLRSDSPPEHKRTRLQSLLKSEAARQAVARISDDRFARLGRCHVKADDRSSSQLRADLLSKVRRARLQIGLNSGVRCAGLLLSYLLSEVHQRASFAERSMWSISEFKEDLALDESSLIDLLGSRDRGVIFGLMAPVPDIPRNDLLQQLVSILPASQSFARIPRICQLSGLSGIGKSSMAAAYIAHFADVYSAFYWVDASTNDSLHGGFQEIARPVSGSSDDANQTRVAVHERLSSAEGRWLLVLDDAQLRSIEPYIPRLGCGDVIVTTIDSALKLRSATVVEVPVMQVDQATAMISARLGSQYASKSAEGTLMRRLAAELDCWPLAIELACGYMLSCGYANDAVALYLDSLKLRSLDDLQSVPFGYPRTLVAAILIAFEFIETLADPAVAEASVDVMKLSAYLGGRRIPLHLTIAARDPNLADLPAGSGPVIVEDPRVMEVLRQLRRVSFVRRDVDLPSVEHKFATANVTYSMNSVLQEVVQGRIECDPQFWERTEDLERLTYHLVVWVSSAGHNGEADRARLLLPHCATLLGHFVRLGLGSRNVALLMGNLANMYTTMHRRDEAVMLLKAELHLLDSIPEMDDFLTCQVRLNLATALAQHEYPTIEQCAEAISYLESNLQYCVALAMDSETHGQSATFCVRSLNVLDAITLAGHADQRSRQLASVYTEMMSRLPRTYEVDAREALIQANLCLSDGAYAHAKELCLPLLTETQYGTSAQLELRRILLEAYLGQEKWTDADIQLDSFVSAAGAEPVYRSPVQTALHNIGIPLAIRALVEKGPSRILFEKVMAAPCFRFVMESAVEEYRVKFNVLMLALAVLTHEDAEIERLLPEVQRARISDLELPENVAWAMIVRVVLRIAKGDDCT